MNRCARVVGVVAVVMLSVAGSESRALAGGPNGNDPINDAWVNGSGKNSGVGNDPINDAGNHHGANNSAVGSDPINDAGNHHGGSSSADEPDNVRHFAIEGNPLGIIIGHYSAQLEWLLVAHHALVFNPHFDYVTFTVDNTLSEHMVGFGGEVGYRFYTSRQDVAGFFVGPSLLLGTYSAGATGADSVSFQSIGGAIDIGGQAVVGPGVVIGGGFGLQYTAITKSFQDLPFAAAALAGGGVRPRFLLSVGYAF